MECEATRCLAQEAGSLQDCSVVVQTFAHVCIAAGTCTERLWEPVQKPCSHSKLLTGFPANSCILITAACAASSPPLPTCCVGAGSGFGNTPHASGVFFIAESRKDKDVISPSVSLLQPLVRLLVFLCPRAVWVLGVDLGTHPMLLSFSFIAESKKEKDVICTSEERCGCSCC